MRSLHGAVGISLTECNRCHNVPRTQLQHLPRRMNETLRWTPPTIFRPLPAGMGDFVGLAHTACSVSVRADTAM